MMLILREPSTTAPPRSNKINGGGRGVPCPPPTETELSLTFTSDVSGLHVRGAGPRGRSRLAGAPG